MNLKKSFEFFKELHKNQKYSDGEPYYPHLLRVGLILQSVLSENNEGNRLERERITIAGFGHDSLEDTKVRVETLKEKFGEEVTSIIIGMTNKKGDAHTSDYVNQVCSSDEEIRLVKLADICVNLMRLMHSKDDKKFLRNKILPVIEPMYKRIIKTKFKKYPNSAKQLIDLSILLMKTTKGLLN